MAHYRIKKIGFSAFSHDFLQLMTSESRIMSVLKASNGKNKRAFADFPILRRFAVSRGGTHQENSPSPSRFTNFCATSSNHSAASYGRARKLRRFQNGLGRSSFYKSEQ
jgi:hypothetical protein